MKFAHKRGTQDSSVYAVFFSKPCLSVQTTVLAISLWILFFLRKKSIESICLLVNYIFLYTDTKLRLEHWKALNSSIFS